MKSGVSRITEYIRITKLAITTIANTTSTLHESTANADSCECNDRLIKGINDNDNKPNEVGNKTSIIRKGNRSISCSPIQGMVNFPFQFRMPTMTPDILRQNTTIHVTHGNGAFELIFLIAF